jgi:hypothetical protein
MRETPPLLLGAAVLAQHAAWLHKFVEISFEELQLHQLANNQRRERTTWLGEAPSRTRRSL